MTKKVFDRYRKDADKIFENKDFKALKKSNVFTKRIVAILCTTNDDDFWREYLSEKENLEIHRKDMGWIRKNVKQDFWKDYDKFIKESNYDKR